MSQPRTILAPTVTLVSRPQFIRPEHLGWRSDNTVPTGQNLMELAGRICYLSIGDGTIDGHQTVKGRNGNREYLHNIRKNGHGSVLEHANYSFLIEGISRSLSHEFVRHRAGFAYSQLSQRYVDESDVAFVVPVDMARESSEYATWLASVELAQDAYKRIIKQKLTDGLSKKDACGAARSVLPNCTETKMVVTANVRAWRFFLEQRASAFAEKEIRRLAVNLLITLQAECPDVFDDMKTEMAPNATSSFDQIIVVGNRKV